MVMLIFVRFEIGLNDIDYQTHNTNNAECRAYQLKKSLYLFSRIKPLMKNLLRILPLLMLTSFCKEQNTANDAISPFSQE